MSLGLALCARAARADAEATQPAPVPAAAAPAAAKQPVRLVLRGAALRAESLQSALARELGREVITEQAAPDRSSTPPISAGRCSV